MQKSACQEERQVFELRVEGDVGVLRKEEEEGRGRVDFLRPLDVVRDTHAMAVGVLPSVGLQFHSGEMIVDVGEDRYPTQYLSSGCKFRNTLKNVG
jgi:hypothetical protein